MANCAKYLPKKDQEAFNKLSKLEQAEFLDAAMKTVKIDKANNIRQAVKHQELEDYISNYMEMWKKNYVDNTFIGDIKGGKLKGDDLDVKARESAMNALLATDRWEIPGPMSLQDKTAGIRQNYQGQLYPVIEELAGSLLDTKTTRKFGMSKSQKKNDDFMRALIDKDFNNPKYKKLTEVWRSVSEQLHKRFNSLGGDIKVRRDWDISPSHDPFLIKDIGSDEWVDDLVNNFMDLEFMKIDESTFREVAQNAFKEITTDGVSTFDIPGAVHKGKIANKHQKARFFKFKDANAFIEYHRKYSSSTPIDIIMDHVNSMSSEIGLMERLGPNPDQMIKNTAIDGTHAAKIYANIAGQTSAENLKIADIADMTRNITSGLRLPGATLTAVADVPLGIITERYNGLPAFGIIKNVISDIGTGGKENRELAARLMSQIDFMIDSSHSASRYADIKGHGKSKWFANSVMKGSFLDQWTYSQKNGTTRSFMSEFATDFSKNENLLRMLDRYGFSETDVKSIQNAETFTAKGSEFLDPRDLPEDLAERLAGAIQAETRYSVVEGDNFTKAYMNQGTKKGTWVGEGIRFASQFKTFPVSFMNNHWLRAARGGGVERKGRIGYVANLMVFSWMAGTIVTQLKEISKGREPIDWDNPELWKIGFVQGGVGSLMIDAMSSDQRGYGGSVQEFLLGPSAGLINDVVWKGMLGSMDDMRKGEREFIDYVKGTVGEIANYVPYQMWYSKAIMEEAFLDEIRRMTDDSYDAKERKRERKRYKELGNNSWR